ncbi:Putative centromere protein Scm3/HJURP [Septoria linicola]|uniref:Centromere protein Scm3/HJURP n=1 Tax=Septoria linicola TaxID=215465 RepID=A0A9Q9AWZ1_9PEZI|nr:putative centromere protein Scm3/HJURP [Septoria linicola]USW54713.1 Putative centromere protein Scm3/HJURP [Septoria linicola]
MATQRKSNRQNGTDALAQLDIDRGRNDQKLKSRFEHIFRKYEHDFTGVGDEFDIHTDEIVVNNGHLEHMRSEVDSGKTASSRFVKTFREKLAHEDESGSSDEDSNSNDDDDDADDQIQSDSDGGSEGVDGTQLAHRTPATSRMADSGTHKSTLLGSDRRPPRLPQLMHLLAGEGTPQRPLEIPDDGESESESVSSESTASTTTSNAMVDQALDRRQSSQAQSRARSQRPAADDETVHALGMSIAKQLAKLMGATSKKKKKKSTTMHRAADPVWSYPEIQIAAKYKRKRSISPVAQPQLSSPVAASPDSQSLWAVSDSPQPGKRRRQTRSMSTASTVVRKFGKASESSDNKRCWNCSLTRSSSWQKGPHGQDLCRSCGQYYEHHGRMKGFDSATPPPSDEQQPAEQGGDIDVSPTVPATSEPTGSSQELGVTTTDEDGPPTTLERAPETAAEPPTDELRTSTTESYAANTSRQMARSDIKRKPWSVEEDALIIRLKEYDRLSWDTIAERFPDRAASAIQKTYSVRLKGVDCPARVLFNDQLHADEVAGKAAKGETDRDGTPDWQWSAQQDELLLELREGDELDWKEIADILPGHSPAAVEHRYELLAGPRPSGRQITDNGQSSEFNTAWRTRQRYTAEEDALIIRLREVDGMSWHQIAQKFDNRSEHSVQSRYSVALRPSKREGTPAVSINAVAVHPGAGSGVSQHNPQFTRPSEQPSICAIKQRTSRSRHSLPVTASSSTQRTGNALLRQALGNSHRRRSDHSTMPSHVALNEPFALDPALRESPTAYDARDRALVSDNFMIPSEAESSAASLQLEEEMQSAHDMQADTIRPDVITISTADSGHNSATTVSRRSTRQITGGLPQEPAQPLGTAMNGTTDGASTDHPTSIPQSVSVEARVETEDDMSYAFDASDLDSAAQQEFACDDPPRTRGKARRHRKNQTSPSPVSVTAAVSTADQNTDIEDASLNPVADTPGPAQQPHLSFSQLVAMAFSSMSTANMSTTDIFSWIESNYSYYSTAPRSWKNFVRDELRTNEQYEVETARKRNTVWRIKGQQSGAPLDTHDEPDDIQGSDTVNALSIPDSDEADIVVGTPFQQSELTLKRRVTFSPVVTVTTPVPVMRLKPSAALRTHVARSKSGQQLSPGSLEIPNSASSSASPLETGVAVSKGIRDGSEESVVDGEPFASTTTRRSGRGIQPTPGRKATHKSGSSDRTVTADNSSSPAFMKPTRPTSIYKTPKQPGWPRIAKLKSHTDPARRHSTPIINHKFMTPKVGMRRRVVETPVRELHDPEEDELAG